MVYSRVRAPRWTRREGGRREVWNANSKYCFRYPNLKSFQCNQSESEETDSSDDMHVDDDTDGEQARECFDPLLLSGWPIAKRQ